VWTSRPAPVELVELLAPVQAGIVSVERRIARAIEATEEPLAAAYRALFAGGKRLRPALALLAAGPGASMTPEVVALGAALEMLHVATLVHDDIIDGATVRRGQPTISARHGEEVGILAGDHLFAMAATVATETGSLEAMRVFAQTLVTISEGELAQTWRRAQVPSLDDYLWMIYAKTACLFESAALCGALLSDRSQSEVERFGRYGHYLGLAFQIADDVLDYVGEPSLMGKPTMKDLSQGILTLPLLLYVWERQELLPGDPMAVMDDEKVGRLMETVVADGFVERALAMAEDFAEKAWNSIEGFIDGDFAFCLRGLARFAVKRPI